MTARSTRLGLALAIAAGLGAGCRQIAEELQRRSEPKVLKSWDGAFRVTVPSGWRTDRDLNEQADLGVSRRAEQCFVVVLSESSADFAEMNLELHAAETLAKLTRGLGSVKVSPPLQLTIASQPALQYEVSGVADNLNVRYLHTTVKLGGFYHQILAWTLASQWERRRETLRTVVQSFAEARRPPAPAAR